MFLHESKQVAFWVQRKILRGREKKVQKLDHDDVTI